MNFVSDIHWIRLSLFESSKSSWKVVKLVSMGTIYVTHKKI